MRAAPVAPGFWRLNGINSFWFASSGMWNSIYLLLATSAALLAPGRKELVVGRATAASGVLAVLVPVVAASGHERGAPEALAPALVRVCMRMIRVPREHRCRRR